LTLATFAFAEAWAAAVNASDWSAEAVVSKVTIYAVLLMPAVAVAVTRSRIACVAMGGVAALVTLVVGGLSGLLFSLTFRFGAALFKLWPWVLALVTITICWAGAVTASVIAFRAASRLKRSPSSGAQIAAQVFD
jgi:hypothetical protein